MTRKKSLKKLQFIETAKNKVKIAFYDFLIRQFPTCYI